MTSENDIIAIENLDVKSMQQNHYIAKSLTKNSISEIIHVLNYKANWNNKKLIEIDIIQVVKYVMYVVIKIERLRI